MKFILEKKVDGFWWFEGLYSIQYINNLAHCAFDMGRYGSAYSDIRVITVDDDFDAEDYKARLVSDNIKAITKKALGEAYENTNNK